MLPFNGDSTIKVTEPLLTIDKKRFIIVYAQFFISQKENSALPERMKYCWKHMLHWQ